MGEGVIGMLVDWSGRLVDWLGCLLERFHTTVMVGFLGRWGGSMLLEG